MQVTFIVAIAITVVVVVVEMELPHLAPHGHVLLHNLLAKCIECVYRHAVFTSLLRQLPNLQHDDSILLSDNVLAIIGQLSYRSSFIAAVLIPKE